MQGSTWSGGGIRDGVLLPYRGSGSGDPPPENVGIAGAQLKSAFHAT